MKDSEQKNIYFAGSIRGGREDVFLYHKLITHLGQYASVLTEHVGNENLLVHGEDGLSDESIYDRDMTWLLSSDVVVAEATRPSLGVGYEIACAVFSGKPVLCLYRPEEGKRLSAMIAGDACIVQVQYQTIEEGKALLDLHVPRMLGRSHG